MKKLVKRSDVMQETLEAYCSCSYSEQQINGLLDTRLKDKTVIVITHKKEVLSKVDQIVVLKEGVVADLGRYDDLVGKSDELNVMLEKAE